MLGLQLKMSLTGDQRLFERASGRLKNLRPMMAAIGDYGVAQATYRLERVLRQNATVVTGNLAASLTVFSVTGSSVTWGSNLPYAAQVNFGGTIVPKEGRKALAIPLVPWLQRYRMGPLDVDPERWILRFVPIHSSKPNVIGVLINPERGASIKRRAKSKATKRPPRAVGMLKMLPVGPVFALATSVTQTARPFMYFDDEDKRAIEGKFNDWIERAAS